MRGRLTGQSLYLWNLDICTKPIVLFLSHSYYLFFSYISYIKLPHNSTWQLLSVNWIKGTRFKSCEWSLIWCPYWRLRAFQAAPVVKSPSANAGDMRRGLNPWAGKIPWRRAWQPTPAVLLGESHGQRSLMGYTVHGIADSQTRLKWLNTHAQGTVAQRQPLRSPRGTALKN